MTCLSTRSFGNGVLDLPIRESLFSLFLLGVFPFRSIDGGLELLLELKLELLFKLRDLTESFF